MIKIGISLPVVVRFISMIGWKGFGVPVGTIFAWTDPWHDFCNI